MKPEKDSTHIGILIYVIVIILFLLGCLIYASITEPGFLQRLAGEPRKDCPEGATRVYGRFDDAGNQICSKEK